MCESPFLLCSIVTFALGALSSKLTLWLPHQGWPVGVVASSTTTMASYRQRGAVAARRALVPLAPLPYQYGS